MQSLDLNVCVHVWVGKAMKLERGTQRGEEEILGREESSEVYVA